MHGQRQSWAEISDAGRVASRAGQRKVSRETLGRAAIQAAARIEGSGEAGTQFISEGWEARLEAHHDAGQLEGAIGLQLTDVDFEAIGEEAFITATNTSDSGIFAVERYDLGGWGIEGGLRFEHREIDNANSKK